MRPSFARELTRRAEGKNPSVLLLGLRGEYHPMTHPKALSTEIGMILQKRDAIDSAAVSSVQADKSWKAEFGPPLHSPWGSSDFLNIHSY